MKIRDVPIEYTNVKPEDFKTFEEYFPHSPFNLLGSGKVGTDDDFLKTRFRM